MFKYGLEKALELAIISGSEEITIYYPKQLVIYLEENENIKDELTVNLKLPNKDEIKFVVPVMKYWSCSADDLKHKKLYALLPLQVFNLRKRIQYIFNSNKTDQEKARLITNEFQKLLEIVRNTANDIKELYYDKEIVGYDLEKMLRVLTNISEYLYNRYGQYSTVSREVVTMVKTLYDPTVKKRGVDEGIKKGIKKGMQKGIEKDIIAVAKKLLYMGMEIPLVVEATGLTEESLIRIKEENYGKDIV